MRRTCAALAVVGSTVLLSLSLSAGSAAAHGGEPERPHDLPWTLPLPDLPALPLPDLPDIGPVDVDVDLDLDVELEPGPGKGLDDLPWTR
ncbi:hypothetical protein GCM10010420_00650 [Streptomyces glaucosporus]|uniref:Secreted protein n=1 Tax=Streptomyces glaucosporus TaxID=284044 RepID=A0ABN3HKE6_9ACTN